MAVHCNSMKSYESKYHFKCPNLTWIIQNFRFKLRVHSFKRRKLGIMYLSKQKKRATNSQISLNFIFWSSDMSRDYN